jgi:cytochrome c biogenesis protein CcmG/thiol:disulfide interchange protein DsbE
MTAPPPRPIRFGTWVLVGVGLLVIVFGAVFASRFNRDPDMVASPMIGRRAPAVAMPYLESDGQLALVDLQGDIVVVNFWASWCIGCRTEHEALAAAAAAYAGSDISFVGVLHQDRPGPGIAFLDEFGRAEQFDYVIDEGSRAGIGFGVLGLPQTFFLDRSGTIVGQVNGPVDFGMLVNTLDAILLGRTIDPVTETGDMENR